MTRWVRAFPAPMREVNTPSGLSVNPLGGVESTADAVDAKSSTNPRRAFHFCDPGRQPLDQFGLHDDQLNEFRVTSVWQLHRLSCNDCQQSARTRRRTQVEDGYNATPPQPKDTSATKHRSCLVTSPERVPCLPFSSSPFAGAGIRVSARRCTFSRWNGCSPSGASGYRH